MNTNTSAVAASAKRKAYRNIVLPLFITSIIAYMDRINLSYAALTMNQDLGFTEEMFGLGAGIFFIGYFLFEIPGALIAERFSPKWWLARIMITWGIASGLMAFVTTAWEFYVLRFLLGVAEASLYPVLYASCIPRWFSSQDRPRAIALMLASLQVSSIVGAPLAGWLIDVPLFHFKGWQGLFILEAIPAIVFSLVIVRWMADWPKDARWLTPEEKAFLTAQYEKEVAAKSGAKRYTVMQALREREVLKLSGTYFLWITGFWGFGCFIRDDCYYQPPGQLSVNNRLQDILFPTTGQNWCNFLWFVSMARSRWRVNGSSRFRVASITPNWGQNIPNLSCCRSILLAG